MRPIRMETETGSLLREMVAMYTQDIIELEKKNIKLENKINRMRAGAKKAFSQLEEDKNNVRLERRDLIQEKKDLESEIESLKIGMIHRDEIINHIYETTDDQEIKDYLDTIGKPGDGVHIKISRDF
ncbi:MAG: hypothetical protein IJ704_03120 [Bacilli bacterium]|nr:hypothetical protein [Bacilli bacterium]